MVLCYVYAVLLIENRLEREVQRLQRENDSSIVVTNNSTESGDTALMHTLRKYDVLKEEYECLRKRLDFYLCFIMYLLS